MKLNLNPFDAGNPMSFKDAAVVALVIAAVTAALGFFDPWTYDMIVEEPGRFMFELFKDVIKTAAATFISLAGLSQLVEKARAESAEPG